MATHDTTTLTCSPFFFCWPSSIVVSVFFLYIIFRSFDQMFEWKRIELSNYQNFKHSFVQIQFRKRLISCFFFYCVFAAKQVYSMKLFRWSQTWSLIYFPIKYISRLAKMKKTPDRLLYTLPYREKHTNTHRTQYKYFTSVYTYTNTVSTA